MVKIIAIDGPASVGKSTLAKKLSKKYDSPVLFSGKLYRAIALETIRRKINPNDIQSILKCITRLDLNKLESKNLYSSEVGFVSSLISARKEIRNKLVKFQREFPEKYCKHDKFSIVEGRDIGTIIFPKADYKIFLWADPEIRAKRRYAQVQKKGEKISYKRILREINARDRNDLIRKIAPLMPASNSVLLDTSYIDIEQAFNEIKKIILKA